MNPPGSADVGGACDATQRRLGELQLLIDKSPALIAYVDTEHIYRHVNKKYYEWLGMRPEDMIGKRFETVIREPHISRAQPYVARVLRGEAVSFESQFLNKHNDLREISVSYTPDVSTSGDVCGFIALVQDITSRKRLEQKYAFLVRLDDAVRPLTEPEVITLMAARLLSQHLSVNRCAYANMEADENTFNLTGNYTDGVASMVGRHTFVQFGIECLRLMRSGEPYVVNDSETDPRTRDVLESYRLAGIRSVICVPLLKGGRFVAAMAVHQISPREWREDEVELVELVASRCWESIERARVSRELRASERRLRLAQKASRSGSFEWLIKEGVIIWSPELEELYGLPQGTFEGSFGDWMKRIAAEDAGAMVSAIEACLDRREPEYIYEFRVMMPDGNQRWLRQQAQFFYDEEGAAERMVGINIDITDQRTNQEELRRINRELEEFAYVASHDLQEPLRMVGIYTYLMLKRMNSEDQTLLEYGAFVRQGVARMEALIQDLLLFSRAVHTEQLPVGVADLSESLTEALSVLSVRIQESQARITTDPLPSVQGDTRQMAHVFQNVLSNALKYSKKNEPPTIHIGVALSGQYWKVSVKDNGIGFEQGYAEKIFRLFARLHGEEYPGTGLGLAICKRIVERYGGAIWAEGIPGSGATIHFSLRRATDEGPAPA